MRRMFHIANLALFLLGVLVIAIVLNFFARQPDYRERIDATKTRAYSLSEQTRKLLGGLEGQWKIAIVLQQNRAERAMRQQIDEVLSRYTAASPHISVVRIDPSDPLTLVEFDGLLAKLNEIYKDQVAAYDRALDAGLKAFSDAQSFAQQQSGTLGQVVELLPENDPVREPLRQRVGVLSLLPDQGKQIVDAVERARQITDARPLPDYETARSVLTQALTQTAADADELAGIFTKWLQRPNLNEKVKAFAQNAQKECSTISQQLAIAADPLKQLLPLELSSIGKQLQEGECAIVISPRRAAVIPSAQLFPKSNFRTKDDGGVSFDQRFRGEQLISATIRSLTVDHMPLVVFVHAEDKSLLQPRDKQADLVGVSDMLKASRFEVAEWMPAKQSTRPTGEKGQPIVWVIVPPPPARTLDQSPATNALIEAASKLVADGESVLLSVSPSLMAKYGQPDPFASMTKQFGVDANTSELIVESARAADGTSQVTLGQAVHEFSHDQLIGRAIEGQQTYFGTPVPLGLTSDAASNAKARVIAAISPSDSRWLERDWTGDFANRKPDPQKVFHDPVPIVIAAERQNPAGAGTQRCLVVGSGGWMISNVADVVLNIGGNRAALINPGNHELLLASAAWLAGMDDLIAASPIGNEIARLNGVTPEIRMRWMWIAVAGLPGVCALSGLFVWMLRRN